MAGRHAVRVYISIVGRSAPSPNHPAPPTPPNPTYPRPYPTPSTSPILPHPARQGRPTGFCFDVFTLTVNRGFHNKSMYFPAIARLTMEGFSVTRRGDEVITTV